MAVYFKVIFKYSPQGTEESRCSSWEWNRIQYVAFWDVVPGSVVGG